jgi:hypothetical protein
MFEVSPLERPEPECRMAGCTRPAALRVEWVAGGRRLSAPYCRDHAQQIAWESSANGGNLLGIFPLRSAVRRRRP